MSLVTWTEEWPSMSAMVRKGTPWAGISVAAERRRSWHRTRRPSTSSQKACQALTTFRGFGGALQVSDLTATLQQSLLPPELPVIPALPLFRRRHGAVETLGCADSLIGVLDDIDITDVELHVDPGKLLLAVTDGVLEARRNDEQVGEERLARLLAADPTAGVDATLASVADAVAVHRQGRARDDEAILALSLPPQRSGRAT